MRNCRNQYEVFQQVTAGEKFLPRNAQMCSNEESQRRTRTAPIFPTNRLSQNVFYVILNEVKDLNLVDMIKISIALRISIMGFLSFLAACWGQCLRLINALALPTPTGWLEDFTPCKNF
jgi:hypothetical protein